MIGASFSIDELNGVVDALGKTADIVEKLGKNGIESIEIRPVPIGYPADEVLRIVKLIKDSGLNVTIHADVSGKIEMSLREVFLPLTKIFDESLQSNTVITVHPIDGDNVAMLKILSDHIKENNIPAIIAFENNRLMPDGSNGDCTKIVSQAVTYLGRENVGVCFDTGHYYNYVMHNHPENPEMLPDEDFTKRIIHTHIQ